MADVEPRVDQSLDDGEARLTLRGDWIAGHAEVVELLADRGPADVRRLTIDVGSIDRLDTFGAWSIETLRRSARASGVNAHIVGVADKNAAILDQLGTADFSAPPETAARSRILDSIGALGADLASITEDLLSLLSILGQLAIGFLTGLRRPAFLRPKSIIHHIDHVGVRAVPIIALMTFLVGCIIAQQGFFYFRKFGATDYVVDLVTILVLREIGVLLVVIMVAGRSGSSYSAEIGSMKMREEIDALRTMGLDPVDLLILPRVLALVFAVPMLTLVGIFAALCGAGVVAWSYGDMSPAIYLARLRDAATYTDLEVGMIKAPIMALVIGVIAALEGLKVQGSAESLGLGTTASVVKSIFLVIVLDGCFAVLFAVVGM